MIKFELLEVGQVPTGTSPSQNKKSYWYKYCTRRKIILLLLTLIVMKIIVIIVAYNIFFSEHHNVISANKTIPLDRIDTPFVADSSGKHLNSAEHGYTILNPQILDTPYRVKISSTSERTEKSGEVPYHVHPSFPNQGAEKDQNSEGGSNPREGHLPEGAENFPKLEVNPGPLETKNTSFTSVQTSSNVSETSIIPTTETNRPFVPFKTFFKPKMRYTKPHLSHNMTSTSQSLETSKETTESTPPAIPLTESTGTDKPRTYLCGRRTILNPNFVEVPGINTYFGEYPWMLELFYLERPEKSLFKCGASLIGPDIALTSAHCIKANTEYWVKAGDWYNRDVIDDEFLPEQTRDVIDLRIHPQYSSDTLENNIALLKLSPDIEYADNVSPVCLPDWNLDYEGENCEVTGWGRDGSDIKTYNHYLRKVGMSIIDRHQCQEKLRTSQLGAYFEVTEGYKCAWNRTSDINSCKGDGGGPLICPLRNDSTIFVQVGISAWSVRCEPDMPGLYTNVEYYRDWIDDTITELTQEHTPPPHLRYYKPGGS
uniref:Serine protease 42 n=1 Tax=Cacopsylla melanoneura TaxID=428564 RepID=A0A8D8RFZ0_9HEMI